jgi:hypothetical protein
MEFRCTRRKPYEFGTVGHNILSARQGHYIRANSPEEAAEKMAAKFPDDILTGHGFDVQWWKNDDGTYHELNNRVALHDVAII